MTHKYDSPPGYHEAFYVSTAEAAALNRLARDNEREQQELTITEDMLPDIDDDLWFFLIDEAADQRHIAAARALRESGYDSQEAWAAQENGPR